MWSTSQQTWHSPHWRFGTRYLFDLLISLCDFDCIELSFFDLRKCNFISNYQAVAIWNQFIIFEIHRNYLGPSLRDWATHFPFNRSYARAWKRTFVFFFKDRFAWNDWTVWFCLMNDCFWSFVRSDATRRHKVPCDKKDLSLSPYPVHLFATHIGQGAVTIASLLR